MYAAGTAYGTYSSTFGRRRRGMFVEEASRKKTHSFVRSEYRVARVSVVHPLAGVLPRLLPGMREPESCRQLDPRSSRGGDIVHTKPCLALSMHLGTSSAAYLSKVPK